MRNIKNINDLTESELDALFLARKISITAFVPMTEECVVITREGSGHRIDDWKNYFIAFGADGEAWPVHVDFFMKNYEEMELIEQQIKIKSLLTNLE